MSFKTRIYKTQKMGKGKRIVTSGSMGDWFCYEAIKGLCKALFFCCFFWIIIPLKWLNKK